MDEYRVRDVEGKIVTFREKVSRLLTLAMVFSIIAAFVLFIAGIYAVMSGVPTSSQLFIYALVALIYVFVFAHLREKGDMDVSRAVIPTITGDLVEVRKRKSFWITLALCLVILGAVGMTAFMVYGMYTYGLPSLTDPIAVFAGMALVMIMFIVIALILNFLRTKIDFPRDRITVKTIEGYTIELYKTRSTLLTIAMVFTALGAITSIALGLYIYVGSTDVSHSIVQVVPFISTSIGSMYLAEGIPFIVFGLAMLICTAILNFLRVRGHVRPIQESMHSIPIRTSTYSSQQDVNTSAFDDQDYLVDDEEPYSEDEAGVDDDI